MIELNIIELVKFCLNLRPQNTTILFLIFKTRGSISLVVGCYGSSSKFSQIWPLPSLRNPMSLEELRIVC